MSTTETAEQTALLCPGCGGKIEVAQTICDACRSAVEEQVMAVRAADYPRLFQDTPRNVGEMYLNPIDPTSTDMLKVAEQTSDDLDLVPLVPMDEPRRNGAEIDPTTTLPSKSSAEGASSAMAVAAPITHYPVSTRAASPVSRPSQTLYSHASTPRLEPTNRWKHVLIAVGFVVAAAVLAMVLWSVLVPRH